MKSVKGWYSVAFFIRGDKKLHLIRVSAPLVISKTGDNYYFSSEFCAKSQKIRDLEDYEYGYLTPEGYKMVGIFNEIAKEKEKQQQDNYGWNWCDKKNGQTKFKWNRDDDDTYIG